MVAFLWFPSRSHLPQHGYGTLKERPPPPTLAEAVTEPEQCDELCYVDPDAERPTSGFEVSNRFFCRKS